MTRLLSVISMVRMEILQQMLVFGFMKRIFIKRKRAGKIVFEQQNEIVNKPLCVYVLPYEYTPTLRTDIIGYCSVFYKLYFRDV